MFDVRQTETFSDWMDGLRDKRGRAVIARRIDRVARGNIGDTKAVGDKVSELRIDFGPGYRVYFTRKGNDLIVLLCGGDKDDQTARIKLAKELAEEVHDDSQDADL